MPRRPSKKRQVLGECPLDTPEGKIRIIRKTYGDNSQVVEIQRWVKNEDGYWRFQKPAQYLQIPVDIALVLGMELCAILGRAHQEAKVA